MKQNLASRGYYNSLDYSTQLRYYYSVNRLIFINIKAQTFLMNLSLSLTGVTLVTEETSDIREFSTMTRDLCVRLVDFGEGLERYVIITELEFQAEGFAAESKQEI